MPDRVPYGPSCAVGPIAGSRPVRLVACRRARRRARRHGWSSRAVGPRRIACRRARRPISVVISRLVSATSVSLPCPRSGEPNARHLPCPGPTARCSRRRHRRFTNMYSFTWPWCFIVACSAARLSAIVGPLSTPKAVAGRTGSSNITGNNRPSSGHFRTFPGIVRASSGHRRTRKDHRVPYRPSPVTPSRMARRVRKEPVPDRVR